jgi:septal ring factor EnvC (AmiA/AmiB activator)
VAPVAGPIARRFGAPAEDGPAAGITYDAAAGAYVAGPCGGRVAFAAPFRSYGHLLIVECGGGYDLVLAGLGAIFVSPGQRIGAGEPVGRMPAEGGGTARLYVELRAGGQPVDPAPYLAPFRNVKG